MRQRWISIHWGERLLQQPPRALEIELRHQVASAGDGTPIRHETHRARLPAVWEGSPPVACAAVRFIVYGAGAIGGSLGGLLHAAGHDVTLIARGAHLRALRDDGLLVRTPEGQMRHHLPVAGDPAEVGWRPGDVVLLAVKSQDTEAALRALPPDVTVACVQNGVANERMALRYFAQVQAVCVMFPTTHLTPGAVAVHSAPVPGILHLGRYPSGVDETAVRIASAFQAAGFLSQARPDIMRWKYRKLLMNVANAVEAVCGPEPGIVAKVREEGERVLAAVGIDVASEEEDQRLRDGVLQVREVEGETRVGSSSAQSLARGTGSIEADFLNGEIVLLGRLHGIATPYNEHARRTANRAARDGLAPGSVTSAQWLSTLDL